MTEHQIKLDHFQRCKDDLIYFAEIIYDSMGWNMNTFIRSLFESFSDVNSKIVIKQNGNRQSGMSTAMSVYALWIMIHNYQNVVEITKKFGEFHYNNETIKRIMASGILHIFGLTITKANRHQIELSNGSSIKWVDYTIPDILSGMSISTIIVDNYQGFNDNNRKTLDKLLTSVMPSLVSAKRDVPVRVIMGATHE